MHLTLKRKLASLLSASTLVAALFVVALPGVVSAAPCFPTTYEEPAGTPLTAAYLGGVFTSGMIIDATGCDIGIYYAPGTTGSVTGADIYGAKYYGVLADGANVDVINSHVHNIGNVPFDGAQHGDAIAYRNGATGTISGNQVDHYQKTGILVTTGSSAQVLDNTVAGLGDVDYIAQNGIQISYGATATVRGNTVSGNSYTPKSYVSCGILLYQADGVKTQMNKLFDNEINFCNFGRGGGNVKP